MHSTTAPECFVVWYFVKSVSINLSRGDLSLSLSLVWAKSLHLSSYGGQELTVLNDQSFAAGGGIN